MKKLLSLFGVLAVTATTASTVISCKKNKIPLNTVILIQELGTISIAGSTPTIDELITAIKAKNPGANTLNKENISIVGQATATTALVQGSREYQDSLTLTYTAVKAGSIFII